MEETRAGRSVLGTTLTTAGAILGVLAVIAMRIGLKGTFTPDSHDVTLIRNVISASAFGAFGLSAALILGGAWVGRRRRLRSQQLEHESKTHLQTPSHDSNPLGFSTQRYPDALTERSDTD